MIYVTRRWALPPCCRFAGYLCEASLCQGGIWCRLSASGTQWHHAQTGTLFKWEAGWGINFGPNHQLSWLHWVVRNIMPNMEIFFNIAGTLWSTIQWLWDGGINFLIQWWDIKSPPLSFWLPACPATNIYDTHQLCIAFLPSDTISLHLFLPVLKIVRWMDGSLVLRAMAEQWFTEQFTPALIYWREPLPSFICVYTLIRARDWGRLTESGNGLRSYARAPGKWALCWHSSEMEMDVNSSLM